jgi:hypothetical protein
MLSLSISMKLESQRKAAVLRRQGLSIAEIAQRIKVSKGSVSTWVREIELEPEVLQSIKARSHSAAAVEKRRKARLQQSEAIHATIIKKAQKEIGKLTKRELFLIGTALYWGGGSKKKRGVVEFTNSDPAIIILMKRFLEEVCGVPIEKMRGHVYLHEHLSIKSAERYWSDISGLPLLQFHKTSIQHNKRRLVKDTLPQGTFALLVCDTTLRLRLEGWMRGLAE